ncbi:nucleotidyltransferase domain-containing protein [Saliterribacillus persicus]|uniref:Putative nucleotidyltransferase n=1 Tax=Saliterribacillus persicus TaxID=930114 RepID=A0A368Y3Z1_9BACI|nr:nucleotidyltransferase domain-containing protein [Saliterribacillus persicus]RCW74993.1 putative nucleotidyltransferase [Saliterribacillus persicus]
MSIEELYQQIQQISRSFSKIEKILLFGSRAHHDHEPRSDIDLAVIAPEFTEADWYLFADSIENTETLLKFDLIRWEHAPKELREEIERCNEVVYSRKLHGN